MFYLDTCLHHSLKLSYELYMFLNVQNHTEERKRIYMYEIFNKVNRFTNIPFNGFSLEIPSKCSRDSVVVFFTAIKSKGVWSLSNFTVLKNLTP